MYKLAVDRTSRGFDHHRALKAWGWTYPLKALITSLVHEWRIYRSIEQLRAFDDHMLKDIGVTRLEIDTVVRYGRDCDETRRRGGL